uniref:Uncharacterized protein n=1 Tax=viral metagenome TaxID=1070528 RepID=A0A6C0J7A4_9ZZZZ
MLDCENIMLIGLVSIIIIIIILIVQKNNFKRNTPSISNTKTNLVENFENKDMDKQSFDIRNLVSSNSQETFSDGTGTGTGSSSNEYKDKYDELKKYMEIQGMYPMGKQQDMSKYITKSEVAKEDRCSDMSKYILKASVPPPVQCPTINKDEWVRKSGLPPNWNKECPAHPDLTNFVLKSTIPPTQKCPSCICPKVKVDAGLCREPTEEDAIKGGLCKNACPKPDPLTPEKCAGIIKCPSPKPCPPPPNVVCPQCPSIPEPAPCPRPPLPPPCPKPLCPTCPDPKEGKCPTPERCPPSQNCPKCYGVKYVKVPVVKSEPLPKPDRNTIFPQDTINTKLLRQFVPEQPRQPRMLEGERIREREREKIPEPSEEDFSAAPAVFVENRIHEQIVPSISKHNADNRQGANNRQEPANGTCDPVSLNSKFGILGFNTKS